MNMAEPLPDWIRFGREVCGDLAQAERREWWLSNGLGAYAAGTIAGTLTRRYHGLLTAPIDSPLGRHLLMAKADATLIDGDRYWHLGSNRWSGGAVEPAGYLHIESFRLEGRMPVWRYAIGDIRLEQRIWMEQGEHTTYVAFRLLDAQPQRALRLNLRLLANARDHHHSARAWGFNPGIEQTRSSWLRVIGSGHLTLTLTANGGTLSPQRTWIENFELSVEAARGLDKYDNHLCVGEADLLLDDSAWVGLVISLRPDASPYLEEAMRRFQKHEVELLKRFRLMSVGCMTPPPWIDQLALAADSFVFRRAADANEDGESVIAGYPWFGDWGRDTMIALPGLTLATGRSDSARRILETFARYVDRGMLPNVFPGTGDVPEYNTVDAALWYIEAWRAYLDATRDNAALNTVFEVLESVIDWHLKGTRYGIHVDPVDSLLYAGEAGVQLTWMDAKISDWVVTPRTGKPVEINALWYNAVAVMERFAQLLRLPGDKYTELKQAIASGFKRFVKPQGGLLDLIDGPDGDDASIRPNQILAVSLPHSPLATEVQRRVLTECAQHLLCSYGLRSLSPAHPDYRPYYRGGVWERDGAYHQGTVWAWQLGHFALARFRLDGDARTALACLEPVREHLLDAGVGTVSEIFDGAVPHTPGGAPAQAWSVACVLEAWVRITAASAAGGNANSKGVQGLHLNA